MANSLGNSSANMANEQVRNGQSKSQNSPIGDKRQNMDNIAYGSLSEPDDPVISQVMFLPPLRAGIPPLMTLVLGNAQVVYTNPLETSMPIRAVTTGPELFGNSKSFNRRLGVASPIVHT
ncbi:viral protein 4 [Sesbania bispinosa]|nr:viral protein 4 [Sesbania bispinosa]